MTDDEIRARQAGDIVRYDGNDSLFDGHGSLWRLDERHNANGVAWATRVGSARRDDRAQLQLRNFTFVERDA